MSNSLFTIPAVNLEKSNPGMVSGFQHNVDIVEKYVAPIFTKYNIPFERKERVLYTIRNVSTELVCHVFNTMDEFKDHPHLTLDRDLVYQDSDNESKIYEMLQRCQKRDLHFLIVVLNQTNVKPVKYWLGRFSDYPTDHYRLTYRNVKTKTLDRMRFVGKKKNFCEEKEFVKQILSI